MCDGGEQVIQWLNKELNEAQTGGRPYVNIPSRVSNFKPALHPSLKPTMTSPGGLTASATASATGTSAVICDPLPLGSAPASFSASLALPAATTSKYLAAEGDAFVPGKALASLKSKAGMAYAEQGAAAVAMRAADGTNTTGGFSDYLAPAAGAIS